MLTYTKFRSNRTLKKTFASLSYEIIAILVTHFLGRETMKYWQKKPCLVRFRSTVEKKKKKTTQAIVKLCFTCKRK